MSDNPLVSVIIPTYNRASLIEETLYSILQQTYQNWECLVVNDGSDDDTEKIVKGLELEDERIKYSNRPSYIPKGGNGARNYGFSLSKGQFIQWFDDDDTMLPNYLSSRLQLFEDTTKLVICSGFFADKNLSNRTEIKLIKSDFLFKDYVLFRLKVFTPSVLFRKSYLDDKDLFDKTLERGQETEFFSRLFYELDYEHCKFIDTPLFIYRSHPASKTVKNEKYIDEYKVAETKIALANLDRSIQLGNSELIQFLYRLLVNLYFRGIDHHHKKNVDLILKSLPRKIQQVNSFAAFQFRMLGHLLQMFNTNIYKVEMYLKRYTIVK